MLKRDTGCTKCGLHATAQSVCLLGKGPKRAEVMIVGEAPGRHEDEESEPFVGDSGKLLSRLLERAGVKRSDVYITNAVHCRPPDNRTPKKREIQACYPWLLEEIRNVKPKYVLTLGNVPLEAITGTKGIRDHRGRPLEYEASKFGTDHSVVVFPAYHPSFALRDPRNEPVLERDIKHFFEIVKRGTTKVEQRLNRRIILTKADLEEACRNIAEEDEAVAYDLETSGLDAYAPGAWITSLGIATSDTEWCLPVNHRLSPLYNKPNKQKRWALKLLRSVHPDAERVGHNGKFDTGWIKVHWGIWFHATFDTMLAHYNLDENAYHGLDHLASQEFGALEYDIPLSHKHGRTGTLEEHCEYLALDIHYTRRLWRVFRKKLQQDRDTQRIFQDLTMPVSRLYAKAEHYGVPVHREKLRRARMYWRGIADEAERELNEHMPEKWKKKTWKDKKTKTIKTGINWGSPQQVAELMFEDLGLEPLDRTGKGEPSVSESVMLRLADKHPIPKLLLKWREAQKSLSTFVEGWSQRSYDGRVHCNFKIHGTVTGRPSCEDPNWQQTPRDPRLRSIIDEEDEDWVLVDADLSQAELRFTAEESDDPQLKLSYQTGVDVHTLTVQRIFGIMKPTKEERKKGKAINFGFVYGMGWKKFKDYARDNYGVEFSDAECKKIRKAFFRLYSGLPDWHERRKSFARRNGYVRSLIGRKRRLPDAMLQGSGRGWEARSKEDMLKAEAERQAVNSPIQSLASDVNLMAALQIDEEVSWDICKFIGSIHDANLWLIRRDKLDIVLPKIKEAMEWPSRLTKWGIKFSVPIVTEIEVGPWGAATHLWENGRLVAK